MVAVNLLLIVIAGYLLGSIPTAIIAGKLLKGIDVREHGSGNAGATNVFRVLGWQAGLLVLAIDIAKGFVATKYASQIALVPLDISPVYLMFLGGVSAVFGHIWTVFAGFKGGKGVGAAAGMLIALYPVAVLVCFAIFAVVVATTRYVSLGSITAAVSLPVVLWLLQSYYGKTVEAPLYWFSIFVAILIVFTHRSNLGRLLAGTENKFGSASPKTEP